MIVQIRPERSGSDRLTAPAWIHEWVRQYQNDIRYSAGVVFKLGATSAPDGRQWRRNRMGADFAREAPVTNSVSISICCLRLSRDREMRFTDAAAASKSED